MPDDLGTRLRAARDEAGLTRRDVAKALDTSEGHVYRWENGTDPRPANLLGLMAVLDLDVRDLMPEAPPPIVQRDRRAGTA